jgi:N-dimethylarginine dimethylaminohydrolase
VGGKLRGVLASLEIEREALAPAGALLRWVGLSERDSQRAISGLATWLGEQEVEGSGVLLSPWA